jgi:hypothetical protein
MGYFKITSVSNKNIMIYKFILKLFFCSIGVALLNLITYGILSINYADNVGSWPNIVSGFFRDLLFRNNFYLFHYSIILSILGFVSYLLYEYFIDQKSLHEKELITLSIKNDLYAIGGGNFIWGVVLMFIGLALWISNVLFGLFLHIPYVRGWHVLFLEDYFNYPTMYFYIFGGHDGMSEFIFGLIDSVIFLLFLFASFAKRSRFTKNELETDSWAVNTAYKYHNKIRLIYLLYLIYLTPTIFVWLYPIILNWLDKLPSDPFSRIRFSYKVLSYLFVSGFILTIYKIIKNNRRVMMANMKAEIKNEILNEKNSP